MNRLFGPIPPTALHIVVDMQELFRSHPEWGTQALTGIIPPIQRLLTAKPENAYFSRFIPAQRAEQASGTWQRYYHRWHSVTLDQLDVSESVAQPGLLLIGLEYTIRSTNSRFNMVYPFYINEATTPGS